jgi:hypothetical protein
LRLARRLKPTVTFSKLGALGQFGNQLFQIAAVLGYAARHGHRACLPPWRCQLKERSYDELFPWIMDYRGSCGGDVIPEASFRYQHLPVRRHADLQGNFQSERYFHHIRDQIRMLFSEPQSISLELDAYCRMHGLGEFDALHVRFYAHSVDKKDPLEALPGRYFARSAAMLSRHRPLVVATDNKAAFIRMRDEIGLRNDLHLLQLEDPLLDFYMLSRARRIAISNSSFGWWAAYLGAAKEQVIAPHRYFWFSAKARVHPFRDTRDLYPAQFDELIV